MALTVKPLNKVRGSVPVKEVSKPSPAELVRVNIEVEKEDLAWQDMGNVLFVRK